MELNKQLVQEKTLQTAVLCFVENPLKMARIKFAGAVGGR
jgi:hypothetical protein